MSLSRLKESAARSSARMKSRTSPPPLEPQSPAGQVKATSRGTKYRVRTVSLYDLPGLLAREELEPKLYFYYPPEGDFVLGVRKKGEEEVREL